MNKAAWAAARAELARAALITAEEIPGVTFPYIRFHPTLAPYLAGRLDPDRRAALEARYRQAYYELAGFLYNSDSKMPHQARAIAARELLNLRRALDLTLAVGDWATAVDLADDIARFLDVFGRWRERDRVLAQVQAAAPAPGAAGQADAEYVLLSRQGETLRAQGRAAEAEQVFRGLLARLGESPSFERADKLNDAGPLPGCPGPARRCGPAVPAGARSAGGPGPGRRRAAADRHDPYRPGRRAGGPGALRPRRGGI